MFPVKEKFSTEGMRPANMHNRIYAVFIRIPAQLLQRVAKFRRNYMRGTVKRNTKRNELVNLMYKTGLI